MGMDEVHAALRKLCAALESDGIPYAIAGAMALNAHGYLRVTTDVDVLLTRSGLAAFKEKHLGLGWVERFPGSKGLRDTQHNVKIDVLIAGDYPGDRKPKAVAFPDPTVAIRGDEVMLLPVERLVELKLASGMTNSDRMKDLADVQELIRAVRLPARNAERSRCQRAVQVRGDLARDEARSRRRCRRLLTSSVGEVFASTRTF